MSARRARTRISARRTACNRLKPTTVNSQRSTTEYEYTKSKWIHAAVSRKRLDQEPLARGKTKSNRSMDGLVQTADGSRQSHRREPARTRRQNRVGQKPLGIGRPICRIEGSDWRLFSARRGQLRRGGGYRAGMPWFAVRCAGGSKACG